MDAISVKYFVSISGTTKNIWPDLGPICKLSDHNASRQGVNVSHVKISKLHCISVLMDVFISTNEAC